MRTTHLFNTLGVAVRLTLPLIAAILIIIASPAPAKAQSTCTPDWLPMFGTGPRDENVFCSLVADIDGPGGDGEVLVLGGRAGVLVYRHGVWEYLGNNLSGDIYALAMYDPDDDGPQPASLIAGGNFSLNSTACGVARYDRVHNTWAPMTFGISYPYGVRALAVFDPDGSGPLPPMLYAGGDFATINGVSTPYLVKYDGTSWTSGGAFNNVVRNLRVFDPDGDGPLPAQLYASGTFSNVGVPAARLARFDGASWSAVGSGVSGTIYQLNVADTDGPGPQPARLVASGSFSVVGNSSLNNLAAWNGTAWSAIGPSLNGAVETAGLYDPDGPGPAPARLVVGGWFFNPSLPYQPRMFEWTGFAWSAIDNAATLPAVITGFDVDGTDHDALVVAGGFEQFGGVSAYHAAAWDGASWKTLNTGVDDYIYSITQFDPDGAGGAPPRLFIGGGFRTVGGQSIRGIAQWDGAAWSLVGGGFAPTGGSPSAMCVYDDDGPGPHSPKLIVGGSFTGVGGVTTDDIAAWDGASWSALGGGFPGVYVSVSCLTVFDPDGDGPARPLLIAGGTFDHAGATLVTNVAAWNGSTWAPLGDTLSSVRALISFDPDGPGGAPPQLIAGGAFTLANGARGVARWDGAAWQPVGTGIPFENTTGVTSLAVFDPDGPGPLPARLIAAGFFSMSSGAPGNSVAQWDGATWSALGTQAFGTLRKVAVFDPDGEGPAQQLLIACSDSSLSQPSSVLGWDGAAWRELAAPVYHSQVLSYGTFDPDGDGPRPPVLVMGGNLQQTGRYAATHIMAFGCSGAIDVPPPCSPADVGRAGGEVGRDDLLNNNDFIAFITLFFIEDARADLGSTGGLPGADGQFDNNDFIAFINAFFTGCQ